MMGRIPIPTTGDRSHKHEGETRPMRLGLLPFQCYNKGIAREER